MLKLVISLAKSLALIVIVGQEIGQGTRIGNAELVFHVLRGPAAEEGRVAFAANPREALVVAETVEDDPRKLLLRPGEPPAGTDPFRLGQPLLDDLLLAGLDGEVGLGKGDLLLGRVAVLSDQVAGVAGEGDVLDLPLGAGTKIDHFADIGKMVLRIITGSLASGYGLVDDLRKVLPLGVSQKQSGGRAHTRTRSPFRGISEPCARSSHAAGRRFPCPSFVSLPAEHSYSGLTPLPDRFGPTSVCRQPKNTAPCRSLQAGPSRSPSGPGLMAPLRIE